MSSNWREKLKHNHMLLMALACIVPMVILFLAIQYLGLSRSYLYWFLLLLCPLMHLFMMKDMHKGHQGKEGEKKGCH